MTSPDGTTDVDPAELREESIGELLSRLGTDSSLLVHQEIELARTEIAEKAKAAGGGAALTGVGLVLLLGAYGAGVAAAIAGVANVLPVWAAALVIFGGLALVAAVVIRLGVSRLQAAGPPVPQRAIQTAKETPGELVH